MPAYREEIVISKKMDFSVWKKLFKYIFKYWHLIVILVVTMMFTSFYDTSFIPSVNFGFTNSLDPLNFIMPSSGNPFDMVISFKILYVDVQTTLLWTIIIYVIFILLRSLSIFITFFTMNIFEMVIMTNLRTDAFKKIQELSFSYFDKTSSGWLIARLQNDAQTIGEVVSYSIMRVFWIVFDLVFTLVTMFSYSWQYSLLILASTPIIALIVFFFNKLILKYHRIARNSYSYFVGWLAECISGTKTIKTLSIEDTIYNECESTTKDIQKKRKKSMIVGSLFQPCINFLSSLTTAILIILFLTNTIQISSGDLTSSAMIVLFITFVGQIFNPIQEFAEIISDIMESQASAEKIVGLIETKPQLVDSDNVIEHYGDLFHNKKENFPAMIGNISFEHVSFSYVDNVEILHDMNINIKAGTSCAIVGETGSGKSTTVNLLCRFYEPTKGRIVIDGMNYKERSVGWLRNNIGYVQQTPFIFKGTIKDNVRYGKLDATDEEIINACKIVDIDNFIRTLKNGYDTYLEDGGNELSQGQKQLIAFARAIVRDPKLLILDEATSSIDTETEATVQTAINKALIGRTSIIIAHRLSTIVDSDRILVMKDGLVIEDGTHIELMNKKGYYYELYMNQFKELNLDSQIDIFQSQIEDKGVKI
jgi:ATP-binding cassette subfamily B protein